MKISNLKGQEGTVFVTTMVSMGIMIMAAAYYFSSSSQGFSYVKTLEHSTQAKYLADAALSRMFSSLTSSFSTSLSYSNQSLGLGTYSGSIATSSSRYLLTGTGTVNGVSRTSTAEVTAPVTGALNYAVAAGGNVALNGGTSNSSLTVTGNVYGGGNVSEIATASNSYIAVTGNVQAAGTESNNGDIRVTGSQVSGYSTAVSFPTPTYSYYQTIASTNGYYYTTDKTYATGTLPAAPAGGVIYVAGNVTINGTQSTTACIVATGNITVSKTGSVYPKVNVTHYSTYPAFIAGGNFTYTSTGNGGSYLTATGLVYVGGNFSFNSGNHDTFTLTGSLLARGNLTYSPTSFTTSTVTYSSQNPPGFTTSSGSLTIASYNT